MGGQVCKTAHPIFAEGQGTRAIALVTTTNSSISSCPSNPIIPKYNLSMIVFRDLSSTSPELECSRLLTALQKTFEYITEHGEIGLTKSKVSTPLQKCTMCRFKSAPLCWCGGLSIDTASRSGPHGRRSGAGAVVKPGFEVFMLFVCYDCA